MRCPKCKSNKLKYVVSRKNLWKGSGLATKTSSKSRIDFRVVCGNCGWSGVIKP